jgi:elongation factor G
MDSSPPILFLPVFTATAEDRARLLEALREIGRCDATVLTRINPNSGEVLISGTSSDHLVATLHRITDEYRIPSVSGEPRVRFVETICAAATGEGKHFRQTSGRGNYGHVKLRLQPNPRGAGCDFISEITDGRIPPEFIASVEMGVREAAQAGILAGCEFVDFAATLFDGSCHETDSNPAAFQIAGSLAFKAAASHANPVVLEPIVSVQFVVPEVARREMIADLQSRRGQVNLVERTGDDSVRLWAIIPLAEILGYRPHPHTLAFLSWQEKPPRNSGGGEVRIRAPRPRRPAPKTESSASDPNEDWT